MNEEKYFEKIFKLKTIAIVGMSPKQERPSHYVALYLRDRGFKIIPVNPGYAEIAREKCYRTLKDIPEKVDIVDVFRRSEFVYSIATAAIEIGASALWLQDGVIQEEAALLAEKAGLMVIMNDCMLRRHKQMTGDGKK